MQGPGDGHIEPLSHCLGAALVEEISGRAVLGVDAMLQRLRQEDGAGADGAICGQERKSKFTRIADANGGQSLGNSEQPARGSSDTESQVRHYQSDPAGWQVGRGGFTSVV